MQIARGMARLNKVVQMLHSTLPAACRKSEPGKANEIRAVGAGFCRINTAACSCARGTATLHLPCQCLLPAASPARKNVAYATETTKSVLPGAKACNAALRPGDGAFA